MDKFNSIKDLLPIHMQDESLWKICEIVCHKCNFINQITHDGMTKVPAKDSLTMSNAIHNRYNDDNNLNCCETLTIRNIEILLKDYYEL